MNPKTVAMIKRHEGFRPNIYSDSLGIPTIGYGRNLRDKGISREEAEYLMNNDLKEVHVALTMRLPCYSLLDDVRQAVLIDMGYNLGVTGLLGFHDTLEAISQGDYDGAGECILATRYASQVGNRAVELVTMLRTGEWLDGTPATPVFPPEAREVNTEPDSPEKERGFLGWLKWGRW